MYNDYASGTVAADLYGFDSYPQSKQCSYILHGVLRKR